MINLLRKSKDFFEKAYLLSDDSSNVKENINQIIKGLEKQIIDLEKTEKLVELFDSSIIHINRNVNARVSFMSDSMSIGHILRSEEVAILKD